MNTLLIILFIIALSPFLISNVYAQVTINVTETLPCFLNYTAGPQMWNNCGFADDPIAAALLPFEWVTGGIFGMIIITVLIIASYIKYHTIIYPVILGIMFLPTSYFLFPDIFLSYAIILAAIGIAGLIYTILVIRTKDY
ncbi:MAG: hypothetical protein IIC67_01780 [Thaumarchaeota archaeon]|nr:hypothetical protein [Nitrososphaerota archaeon]